MTSNPSNIPTHRLPQLRTMATACGGNGAHLDILDLDRLDRLDRLEARFPAVYSRLMTSKWSKSMKHLKDRTTGPLA